MFTQGDSSLLGMKVQSMVACSEKEMVGVVLISSAGPGPGLTVLRDALTGWGDRSPQKRSLAMGVSCRQGRPGQTWQRSLAMGASCRQGCPGQTWQRANPKTDRLVACLLF